MDNGLQSRGNYEKLTHPKRIDIIYYSLVNQLSLRKIMALVTTPFSTIRQIIHEFTEEGRTNCTATLIQKSKMLNQRQAFMNVISSRRAAIDARRSKELYSRSINLP